MDRRFTDSKSITQIKRLWREAKFGDRTRCPYCGHERKLWTLNDDRWKCSKCHRKFGLFTKSWLNRTRFELPEILELLYWFKLDLTDHDIADHLNADYRRVHRFLLRVREALADYEDRTIQVLEKSKSTSRTSEPCSKTGAERSEKSFAKKAKSNGAEARISSSRPFLGSRSGPMVWST